MDGISERHLAYLWRVALENDIPWDGDLGSMTPRIAEQLRDALGNEIAVRSEWTTN